MFLSLLSSFKSILKLVYLLTINLKKIPNMKHFYAFLLIVFCLSISNAQIVNIPDPVFKTQLLNYDPPIDTNLDGEIQESEAQVVTSLGLYHCDLDNVIGLESFSNLESLSFASYCNVATPVDLTALSHLTSLSFNKSSIPSVNLNGLTALTSISVGYSSVSFLNLGTAANLNSMYYYNSPIVGLLDLSNLSNLVTFSALHSSGITAINLQGLVSLESFKYDEGYSTDLTSVDLSDLVNLKVFVLNNTGLTAINFDHNPLLEQVAVSGSNISNIDVCNLIHLSLLSLDSDQLTTLDVSHNVSLTSLGCSDNMLTSLDLSNLHKIKTVYAENNRFTALDFSSFSDFVSNDDPPMYDVKNNPNLISVNLKNGKPDYVDVLYLNCPNLTYLCLDDVDIEGELTMLETNEITNIQINTYCSFVPGGSYNTVTGTLALHPQGCGNGTAYPMPNIKVNINDGTTTGVAYTDNDGHYDFYTQSGTFTIMPELTNPLFSINPESTDVIFTDNLNHTETHDFCIAAVGTLENLEVSLIPTTRARPGFDSRYQLIYRNTGNQVMSGSASLAYDDSVLDLINASPLADTQSTGNLNWNFTNLLPFESRTINLIFNVNLPMESPAVNAGDILHFDAATTPSENTGNHTTLDQTVMGSSDPNDKICLEGAVITPERVGDYLNYVIHFQNSGTAAAENIVVRDLIDTDKFDVGSLQLVGNSHPHQTKITGNKVEFIFENINLPAAIDDEEGSHGYVAFKIKTKNNLVLGNSVSNTADIYFDYNFPTTTNTATTTIALLAKNTFEDKGVSVIPNPVKDNLHITAKQNITSIELFDVQGRLIETNIANGYNADFNMANNASGIYFIKIYTEKGVKVEKIIKQ